MAEDMMRKLGVPDALEELGEGVWDDEPTEDDDGVDWDDADPEVLAATAMLDQAYRARVEALENLRAEEQRLAQLGWALFESKKQLIWHRSKVRSSEDVSGINFNTLSKAITHCCKGQVHPSIFQQLMGDKKLREYVVTDTLHFGINVPARMLKACCIMVNVYVHSCQPGETPIARTPAERQAYVEEHLPQVKKSWKTKDKTCVFVCF